MRERESRPDDVQAAPKEFGGSAHDDTKATAKKAAPGTSPKVAQRTQNAILVEATSDYIAGLDPDDLPAPGQIERDLIAWTNFAFGAENLNRVQGNKITLLKTLTPGQVAGLLVSLHGVVRVIVARDEPGRPGRPSALDPLAVWDPVRGVASTDPDLVSALIRRYHPEADPNFVRTAMAVLRDGAPRVRRCQDRRWVAVANGDYDRATGELYPFSRDRVFFTRLAVDYDAGATNVVIHNDEDGTDWDFDSWLEELAVGDPILVEVFWCVFAAVVQPQVRTKGIGLWNPRGNNGKGSILALSRNLVGADNCADASLKELADPASAQLLSGKALILGDENGVKDFLDDATSIKKLITREPLYVNPKYEKPRNEVIEAAMIQCLNGNLQVADNSDSFWRRWVFVPMRARFEGRERRYIKDDYLARPEVLQYVLKRALEMDFDGTFPDAKPLSDLLLQMKAANDTVRLFWDLHADDFSWDRLPIGYLYELYKSWMKKNNPGGYSVAWHKFADNLRGAVEDVDDGWQIDDQGHRMKLAEHSPDAVCGRYGLGGPQAGFDLTNWSFPNPQSQHRGMVFRTPGAVATSAMTSAMTDAEKDSEIARLKAQLAAQQTTNDDPNNTDA